MTSIELTFLGTTASIPTFERNHPGIYLKYISQDEHCFLFDCGEGTQKQIFKSGLNFMRIDNVFITHWHADHFAGLFGLIETMSLEKREKPLFIYGPEAEKFVKIILNLGYGRKPFEIIQKDVGFRGSKIETVFDSSEYQVLSIPVSHGIPAVAYAFVEKDRIKIDKKKALKLGLPKRGAIFQKLKDNGYAVYKGNRIELADVSVIEKGKRVVYSGDTESCKNLIEIAKNSDAFIIDCTYFENITERHHINLEQAIKIGEEANTKKLVLTHISRRYQNQKELEDIVKEVIKKSEIKDIIVARDFMKVVVK